uniref:Uncharacterized protein n=1 Tax=Rhizophora mucronata TaxID=61149 RepID=A0A2P2QZZ2_RHIMU
MAGLKVLNNVGAVLFFSLEQKLLGCKEYEINMSLSISVEKCDFSLTGTLGILFALLKTRLFC